MPSDKQIEASRLNGAKSRGPVTPEGKRISSRNHLHHGMFARAILLEAESRSRFNALINLLREDLQPESPIEDLLVQKMAAAHWRQTRVWGMETAAIAHDGKTSDVTDPETRDALSFRAASNQMSEYEARCDRQFERSLERFEKFRVARRARLAAASGASNPGTL